MYLFCLEQQHLCGGCANFWGGSDICFWNLAFIKTVKKIHLLFGRGNFLFECENAVVVLRSFYLRFCVRAEVKK